MEEEINTFLSECFLKEILFIKKLVGYEDRNFLVEAKDLNVDKSDVSNFGNAPEENTFILKIVSIEKVDYLDLEFQMMNYLCDRNFSTCRPLQALGGRLSVPWSDPGKVGYLLSYVAGITMLDAENPLCLMLEVGRLAGQIDAALMSFKPDVSIDTSSLWEMSRAPELEPLLHAYCTTDEASLGEEILKAYTNKVRPHIETFQKGFIHGDINNCNIIVKPVEQNGDQDYVISGIIDYGDACSSFYVYELVILMADLMSSCLGKHESLEIAKLLLKGYLEEMTLTHMELQSLRVLICVRLLQLFVLSGEILYNLSEENAYVGLERKENIEVCKYLWTIDDTEFYKQVVEPVYR